jgi:hypothetical protein
LNDSIYNNKALTGILFIVGNNIFEIAKLLKAHKYSGASLSDAITPSSLAQSRSNLRSNNGPSKGKQKAALENVSYPDDGNHNKAII